MKNQDQDIRLNFVQVPTGTGKRFVAKFIEPGIVSYEEQKGGAVEYVPRATLEEALPSMAGVPLQITHADSTVRGTIDKAYAGEDGWFWCEGTLDADAKEKINLGWSVSVGYRVKAYGPGGMHNRVAYQRTVAKIEWIHLALEPAHKVRYEEAEVRLNAVQRAWAWVRALFTVGGEAVSTDTPPAEAEVELSDGSRVNLNALVEEYQKDMEKAPVSHSAVIMVGGKPVMVSELVQRYEARKKPAGAVRHNAVSQPEPVAEADDAEDDDFEAGVESFKKLAGARNQAMQTLEQARQGQGKPPEDEIEHKKARGKKNW